ncbi:hypothetical protein GYMLUDRAFT_47813 [Collybiopsis luxurians FD-317 M1]|uniref:Uncharacterized protein n=1 Tax=Collybiopsis luxurians FD-317 M1 TaxID=944289 RepID=A0A0D0CKH7_9AGAR|nr:hypothetical protein GYMLUDRAFT_47813 [Collybiopsis luxurians FD-317 M1]
MLLRSKTILRKVKLTSILADDAISVIESHPSISELTISGCYDRDYYTEKLGDLFSRLTVASKTPKFTEDTNNVFAPHVQFLNLELYTRTKASVQTFVEDICELVESRSAAKLSGISPSDHRVFPLRRVRLQADLLYADRAQVVEAYRIIGTRLKPLEASGLFVSPKLRDEIDGTVRHFRVG